MISPPAPAPLAAQIGHDGSRPRCRASRRPRPFLRALPLDAWSSHAGATAPLARRSAARIAARRLAPFTRKRESADDRELRL